MNLIVGLIVLDGHTLHKSEVIATSGGHTHTHTNVWSLAVTVVPSLKVSACDYWIPL